MTEQEKAKKLLPIIQAIAEGKKIQYSFNGMTWFDKDENLELNVICNDIISDSTDYRIKPDERFVYKYDDKFVIMDVKIPLIKDSPLFEGSLEECNEWIKEQVKGNYTIEQNAEEKRIRESGVMYLECPVCNHVFFNYEKTRRTIKCYCKHCDKEYYGFDKGDEVIFSEEDSIFTPYKTTSKWKRGK